MDTTEQKAGALKKRCNDRAITLWWNIRPSILPSSVINQICEDDKMYMKFMDEREKIIEAAFKSLQSLFYTSFDMDNILIYDRKKFSYIDRFGDDIIEESQKLYMRLSDQLEIYNKKINEEKIASERQME